MLHTSVVGAGLTTDYNFVCDHTWVGPGLSLVTGTVDHTGRSGVWLSCRGLVHFVIVLPPREWGLHFFSSSVDRVPTLPSPVLFFRPPLFFRSVSLLRLSFPCSDRLGLPRLRPSPNSFLSPPFCAPVVTGVPTGPVQGRLLTLLFYGEVLPTPLKGGPSSP